MNVENPLRNDEYLSVVDASAVLATLQNESGSDIVDAAAPRAVLSSVNLSEVAKKLIEKGMPVDEVQPLILSLGFGISTFDSTLAFLAASLYPQTKTLGLSFADRVCLSLAIRLNIPVLTAEKRWANIALPVEVKLIR